MEYDTERAGGFEPLRLVPKNKTVVLGLVTSKTGELESKDSINRRIDDAGRYLDLDQLCLSPQCGFATRRRQPPDRGPAVGQALTNCRDCVRGLGIAYAANKK